MQEIVIDNYLRLYFRPLHLVKRGAVFYFLTRYAKPTSPHIYTRE
nr:MAG TPA: hypothetical protein [Caudoviricetes sp.]